MKSLILCLFLLLSVGHAFAFDFIGYVKTSNDSELYVQYKEAKEGRATFTFVNGLIYKTEHWHQMTKQLISKGYGVIHYEHEGQLRSFARSMEMHEGNPPWMIDGIKRGTSAEQLKDILNHFNIKTTHLVSLSYGSHIISKFANIYPQYLESLIFIAPMIVSLEKYESEGRNFHLWLDSLDLYGPVGQYWSNYYYDQIFKWYFSKKPSPSTRSLYGKYAKKFNKAVFHQAKSVRHFDLKKEEFKNINDTAIKIHLMTAEKENNNLLKDQDLFWNSLKKEYRGSKIHILDASHTIPNSATNVSADYLHNIAKENSCLLSGRSLIVNNTTNSFCL